MARNNYDDWTFMGDIQKEDRRLRNHKNAKVQQVNSQRNSFIFLCIVCLLTFIGLVCIYSASFEGAVSNGLEHYYYLVKQVIYIAIGLLLAFVINILPEIVIKVLSPISFFVAIVLLTLDTFLKRTIILSGDFVNFLFLSLVMYMSLYFSKRDNNINKIRQLVIPIIACILVLVLILFQRNFSYALMYLLLAVVMFASGGVGILAIILLLLYAAVPIACIVFSKSERIIELAKFIIPGLGVSAKTEQVAIVKSAISSGSWFGKGLGNGQFKSLIDDLAGKNILACICEELGFWGLVMIFLFFAFYAFVGYRASKLIRKQDGFYSNLALGLTTMVIWQFILNILWVMGFLPTDGLSMPFFSYGLSIIFVLIESGLIFRITRVKIETEDGQKIVESIQDQLMFPEKYEFENS